MPTELKTIQGKLALNLKSSDQTAKIDLKQRGYEIMAELQTSLNIEDIIRVFYDHIASTFLISGLSYYQDETTAPLKLGVNANQKSNYNLSIEDLKLGTITFMRRKRFSNDTLESLENLLCSLVYPLRNAIMYQRALLLSQQDFLTGTLNRSAMKTSLAREVDLAYRQDHKLSIIMLDIDLFKRVNDTHGHAAGDDVLKSFTQTVKEITRSSDNFFRYGGEEFVILLSNTDAVGAQLLAERIRINVEATAIRHNKKTISITVSIGLTELKQVDNSQSLLERADKALYKAKNNGRNQVRVL